MQKQAMAVACLPAQWPVAHNLSDNFRRLVGLVILEEVQGLSEQE